MNYASGRHQSVRVASDAMRAAQIDAMTKLSQDNTSEHRKYLQDITDTLNTLRSIELEEKNLVVRVLKRFHLIH